MLPAGLSPVVASYIKRCLHKDRKQRIRDIGDVSLALDGAFEQGAPRVAPSVAVAQPRVAAGATDRRDGHRCDAPHWPCGVEPMACR